MRRILNLLASAVELINRYWDFFIARKYRLGDRILNISGSFVEGRSSKLLIYCIHITGVHVPLVFQRNIELFAKQGYHVSVAVSFSGSSLAEVADACAKSLTNCKIFLRSNIGKDFVAFADLYNSVDISDVNSLVLMNDSLVGPLYHSEYLREIERFGDGFIGITESYVPTYHLQSSFLLFKGRKSIDALGKFFNSEYKIYKNRFNIVKYGEVGLTSFMIKAGVNIFVFLPTAKLFGLNAFNKAVSHCNPQHHFGIKILTDLDFPFIKRELLTKNPADVDLSWVDIYSKIKSEGMQLLFDSMRSRL